jgi:hypothetical protein
MTVGYDWNVTKYRTGSITSTIVHMSQNRVYLHFDVINIHRDLAGQHDIRANRTQTRSTITWLNNVFLEIATEDLSTYTHFGRVASPVRFEDFQWPYSTNVWGSMCGTNQICRTILRGGLSPMVPFPTQIVERHPELEGCFVFSSYDGKYTVRLV